MDDRGADGDRGEERPALGGWEQGQIEHGGEEACQEGQEESHDAVQVEVAPGHCFGWDTERVVQRVCFWPGKASTIRGSCSRDWTCIKTARMS